MSMIQEQLHSRGNVDSINLGNYLESLVGNSNGTYGQDKKVLFNLEMQSLGLNVSQAIPCGLIANAVLTNSFKYAFSDKN